MSTTLWGALGGAGGFFEGVARERITLDANEAKDRRMAELGFKYNRQLQQNRAELAADWGREKAGLDYERATAVATIGAGGESAEQAANLLDSLTSTANQTMKFAADQYAGCEKLPPTQQDKCRTDAQANQEKAFKLVNDVINPLRQQQMMKLQGQPTSTGGGDRTRPGLGRGIIPVKGYRDPKNYPPIDWKNEKFTGYLKDIAIEAEAAGEDTRKWGETQHMDLWMDIVDADRLAQGYNEQPSPAPGPSPTPKVLPAAEGGRTPAAVQAQGRRFPIVEQLEGVFNPEKPYPTLTELVARGVRGTAQPAPQTTAESTFNMPSAGDLARSVAEAGRESEEGIATVAETAEAAKNILTAGQRPAVPPGGDRTSPFPRTMTPEAAAAVQAYQDARDSRAAQVAGEIAAEGGQRAAGVARMVQERTPDLGRAIAEKGGKLIDNVDEVQAMILNIQDEDAYGDAVTELQAQIDEEVYEDPEGLGKRFAYSMESLAQQYGSQAQAMRGVSDLAEDVQLTYSDEGQDGLRHYSVPELKQTLAWPTLYVVPEYQSMLRDIVTEIYYDAAGIRPDAEE